ncbi:MAG: CcmD family protein [Deltaproteobacteria bacterium]|nr:CcmD family protein [Deltaproteobacteria bacterium]
MRSTRSRVARVLAGLVLAAVASAAVAGTALAQEEPRDKAAAGAWDGSWRAGVDDSARDVVSGETMVVVAYGAVWAILFVYVLRLAADIRGLRRETEDLKRLVAGQGGKPPAS